MTNLWSALVRGTPDFRIHTGAYRRAKKAISEVRWYAVQRGPNKYPQRKRDRRKVRKSAIFPAAWRAAREGRPKR
jgi:hypothetical protein